MAITRSEAPASERTGRRLLPPQASTRGGSLGGSAFLGWSPGTRTWAVADRSADETEPRTGHWYLAEDYALCHRVRLCGIPIIADTTIRLWHVGDYGYSWEDAGIDRQRFGDFDFQFS